MIDAASSQLGRGEPIADTARVLDRQAAAIVWRTFGQDRIEQMAKAASVPVINALTDEFHPCQVLADLLTVVEHRGSVAELAGATLTYLGDGANNMAHSYFLGGATAGMHVRIAAPAGFAPYAQVVTRATEMAERAGGSVLITDDARAAGTGADGLTTDTWVSMGQEGETTDREAPCLP